ncbi:hypothetical protein RJ640_011606 [Escallonia rubra]|uniref:Ataxin-10 domain-containing protein n=1 Tax=Escallonia rubra TaxID=112253 RepID=A0AA88RN76_9ASTE|nr:hypothetical protein RJ640_011606 [Escallonia rubra]
MDDTIYVPENILQPLFSASKTSSLTKALESLIEIARGTVGRSELASKNVLPTVLQLCQSLSNPACGDLLLLSLKLLRNLCAGELSNQNSFIREDGVQIVSRLFSCITFASDMDYGIVRMGLQIMGNISLAGEEHQRGVWHQFFPLEFAKIARARSRDTCDPLCMVIYSCYEGNNEFSAELCSDQGLDILTEIIRTASADSHSGLLFSKLCLTSASGNGDDVMSRVDSFVPEQAFFLSILSEILNEQMRNIAVSNDFALFVLEVFRNFARIVESFSQVKSGLPTGFADFDVLGYSLTILRDICACDGVMGKNEGSMDTVDLLLSSGLLELLLNLLCDLEPPALIRKATDQVQNQEAEHSYSRKLCPYKGFRRDLVAVIGNFTYQRKHVQDEIRQRNGILLLLQQCVTDDENPFLREWGIWSLRNLLEGNVENQRVVSELELQGSVNVPEIARLGLRVEVDEKTRRAKLVNVA